MATSDSFWDGLWNKAEGVFDRFVDYEFGRREFDLIRDARAWEAEQAREDERLRRQWYGTSPDYGGAGLYGMGGNLSTLLLIGGAGLLAFALLRK
ncbi:hypothetical protein ABWI00_06045 [Algihabitans albus]|uniref:hypothetical protein n=1 Tax=Algihabitans albus TaxID=2164067 RepID=UPI0035CF56EA